MINNENLDKLIEFVKNLEKIEVEDLEEALEKLKQANSLKAEKESPYDVKLGDAAYNCDNYRNIGKDYMWAKEDIKDCIPCKNKNIIKERQQREYLNALLEKFAYENDANVTEDMWEDKCNMRKMPKYKTSYDYLEHEYVVSTNYNYRELSTIYFRSEEVAKRAITEVVIPFMEGSNETCD